MSKSEYSLYSWAIDNNRNDILDEWDYEKNFPLTPKDVTSCSGKSVWWKCKLGHEWKAHISNRNRGQSCPYCSGHRVKVGFNDFASQYPQFLSEWDYEKNIDIQPTDVTPKSDKKVWWKCEKGHSWEAPIKRITLGSGCPVCANKKILIGYNDLLSQYPELCKEWDYEKNTTIQPNQVTYGSSKKVWWKCKKGHSWEAVIGDRVRGNGCPYCSKTKTVKSVVIGGQATTSKEISGSRILPGYNDIATLYPMLIKEWDFEKNTTDPKTIGRGSELKAWWKCEQGHSWQAVVSNRIKGIGCPICSRGMRISFGEKAIYYYLKLVFPNAIENYKSTWLNKMELDIYIPEISLGIEYDGRRWHSSLERDIKKDLICDDNNIKLIRIREKDCIRYDSNSIKYYLNDDSDTSIEYAIKYIFEFVSKNIESHQIPHINIDNDREKIYSTIYQSKIDDSLQAKYPQLLKDWDYEKNGNLIPEKVFSKSKIKVWWKCENGHSYQSVVHSHANGSGCPYCAGKKVLSGFNDLSTKYPNIAKEWNYNKNSFLPSEVTAHSNKKVWWICSCGYEWEAKINNRTSSHQGCPICGKSKSSNSRTIPKDGMDLKSNYPNLAEEWDYDKNGTLLPSKVKCGSRRKVWWKGSCGHNWEAAIVNRVKGSGCPICAGKKVLIGFNDIATVSPKSAKRWDYDKNNTISINDITAGSHKKVWWKCPDCNYSYQKEVYKELKGRCPNCKK